MSSLLETLQGALAGYTIERELGGGIRLAETAAGPRTARRLDPSFLGRFHVPMPSHRRW